MSYCGLLGGGWGGGRDVPFIHTFKCASEPGKPPLDLLQGRSFSSCVGGWMGGWVNE